MLNQTERKAVSAVVTRLEVQAARETELITKTQGKKVAEDALRRRDEAREMIAELQQLLTD